MPKRLFFALALAALAALKLILATDLRLQPVVHAGYDDFLFVRLGKAIANGDWLGNYDYITMSKGPIYPVFLAINQLMGWRLTLAQQSLYLLGCILVAFGLVKLNVKPVAAVATFALLAFNPLTYALPLLWVVRDLFFTGLLMSWFGVLLLMLGGELRRKAIWGGLFGTITVPLWYTREEALLFVPTLVLGSIAVFRKPGGRRFLGAAVACVVIGKVWLLGLNYGRFRTFDIIETTSGPYVAAYKKLSTLKPPNGPKHDHVPAPVREKLYAAVPSFRELKPYLDGGPSLTDYGSGSFAWHFRRSVSEAGYHTTPKEAGEYYQRLGAEIDDACAKGALDCPRRFALLGAPFEARYIVPTFETFLEATRMVVHFEMEINDSAVKPYPGERIWQSIMFEESTHDVRYGPNGELTDSARKTYAILDGLRGAYGQVMPYFLGLGLLVYLLLLAQVVRTREGSTAFFVASLLYMTSLIRVFGISYVEVVLFPGLNNLYLSPVHPMLLTATGIALSESVRWILRRT